MSKVHRRLIDANSARLTDVQGRGVPHLKSGVAHHASHDEFLALHRAMGNRGVRGLLKSKIRISQPEDLLEREADEIADQIIRQSKGRPAVGMNALSGNLQRRGAVDRSAIFREKVEVEPGEQGPEWAVPFSYRVYLDPATGQLFDTGTLEFYSPDEMNQWYQKASSDRDVYDKVAQILERKLEHYREYDKIAEECERTGKELPKEWLEFIYREFLGKEGNQVVHEAFYEATQQSWSVEEAGSLGEEALCRLEVSRSRNPFLVYPMWIHERVHQEDCMVKLNEIRCDYDELDDIKAEFKEFLKSPINVAEWERDAYAVTVKEINKELQSYDDRAYAKNSGMPVSIPEPIEVRRVAASTGQEKAVPGAAETSRINVPGGENLPLGIRELFEPMLQHDLSAVRVHHDTAAANAATALSARAYTIGNHIVFGVDEYAPQTDAGKHLLAHELVHVIQQAHAGVYRQQALEIQRKVRPEKVRCTDYPSSHPVIRSIGTEDPVTAIDDAAEGAVELLDHAIGTLRSAKSEYEKALGKAGLSGVVSDEAEWVASVVYKVFELDPRTPKALSYLWAEQGPQTVDVVIRRLEAARKILDGGEMSYVCLGEDCYAQERKVKRPQGEPGVLHPGHEVLERTVIRPPSEGVECNLPTAYVTGPDYRIYLCKPWWHAPHAERSSTLIHEALHIYYAGLILDDGAPMVNPYYYQELLRALSRMGQK